MRQSRIHIYRPSDLMAAMGEPSLLHLELGRHLNCLLEIDMGIMRMVSQCLHDEIFHSLEHVHEMTADLAQVGDIGEVADTKSVACEGIVFHPDRLHMKVTKIERLLVNEMHLVGGSAGIEVFLESIGELSFDFRQRRLVNIKRHRLVALLEDERPDIVEASDMVLVFMGDEYRIQSVDPLTQHLLAEIGTRIHSHRHLFRPYQY